MGCFLSINQSPHPLTKLPYIYKTTHRYTKICIYMYLYTLSNMHTSYPTSTYREGSMIANFLVVSDLWLRYHRFRSLQHMPSCIRINKHIYNPCNVVFLAFLTMHYIFIYCSMVVDIAGCFLSINQSPYPLTKLPYISLGSPSQIADT